MNYMKTAALGAYIKLASIIIIICGSMYLLGLGRQILLPLSFAFLISLLLLPVCNFFENRARFSRTVSAVLAVFLLIVIVCSILYALGSQVAALRSEWPQLKEQMNKLVVNVQESLEANFHLNIEKQKEYINKSTQDVLGSAGNIIEQTLLSVSSLLLFLIFIIIYSLFILIYRRQWMRFTVALFTDKHRTVIMDISENIKNIIRKYIIGLFLEMVMLFLLGCLIFWILGLKYVFLIALIMAVFNLIPYIGIYTALVIGAAITFATVDGPHALYLVIAVVAIHTLDANLIMPKIVGSQIKINPLMVITGVVVGELIWGIPGMFLSIPYMAIAKVIFDRIPNLKALGILLGDEENPPRKAPVRKRR
jgi:putative permease